MIREGLKRHYIGMNQEFRHRGEDAGRLENFSDAVFALAITLLLISTSPPTNFDQLIVFTNELLPFALCITLLILIWHEHFIFFLRYGLRNPRILFLNTLFLFIILFYVYPLKFLTRMLSLPILYFITGNEDLWAETASMINQEDISALMIIYGLGASAIFLTLALMYRYALKSGIPLELNQIELFDTRQSLTENLVMGIIPLISVLLAVLFRNTLYAGPISGFFYFTYVPVMVLYGKRFAKKRKALLKQLSSM